MRTGEPPRGPGGRFEHLSPRPLAPVLGAASQNRHDSNHKETGKGDPFWKWEPGGAQTAKSRWFRSNIIVVWNRFMVLSNHGSFEVVGGQNSACYWTGTLTLAHTRTRAAVSLENPKD